MIFVTVGSHEPFDRMVRTVDAWAEARKGSDVFGQIGPSEATPIHMKWVRFLDPAEFRRTVAAASAVVAHAGAGCILTALDCGTPIIVLPRCASLGETRSDHQLPMAERFAERGLLTLVRHESDLAHALDGLGSSQAAGITAPITDPRLLAAISGIVDNLAARFGVAHRG